ncbi:uncharacterized protein LOC129615216 [Condylostylus longicornis]|uniref:uncharacterized protein LOC129615216 n=1 Tax=Condylostylus longicornis TaxID=2530218 RepID=UPI00244DB52C|nr:uncharacterized protein LOC129615216 [Condylostylus longicornis]
MSSSSSGNFSIFSISLIKLFLIKLIMTIATGSCSSILESSILNNNNTIIETNKTLISSQKAIYNNNGNNNKRPDNNSNSNNILFLTVTSTISTRIVAVTATTTTTTTPSSIIPNLNNENNYYNKNFTIVNDKIINKNNTIIKKPIDILKYNISIYDDDNDNDDENDEILNELQSNYSVNEIFRPLLNINDMINFRYSSENYSEYFYETSKEIISSSSNYNLNFNSNNINNDNRADENSLNNKSISENQINNENSIKSIISDHYKVNEVFENEKKLNFKSKNNFNDNNSNNKRRNGKIVILGLFELSTKYGKRPEGLSELGAAKMAVEHINKKNLLPGYTIELLTNDTQCDPGVGVDRFFHALYTQHSTRMVMLLGSACSEVTESLAKVVPYWNIVQVSFGSTSPALSDRHEFPFFYRTVAPDSSHNPARIAFIRKFGWDTVTTFSQNEEVHSLAVNDLVTELESSNISCAATITFAETDFKEQLLLLRDLDTRIIIGSFSKELAPKIFCEAYKLGMFGADYAWILHESMSPPWLDKKSILSSLTSFIESSSSSSTSSGSNEKFPVKTSSSTIIKTGTATTATIRTATATTTPTATATTTTTKTSSSSSSTSSSTGYISSGLPYNADCFHNQLMEAVENLIIVSSHNSIVGNQIGLSGLNNEMFLNELNLMKVPKPMSKYAPQTYDAVWAIALALRGAEDHWKSQTKNQSKLDNFDYTRYDMALEFLQQIGKLNFLGVSGPVSFSGPDRIGTTAFYQIQKGTLEPVALYYPAERNLDFHCPNCKTIKWHSGQIPIAKRIFKLRVVTIAPLAFYTIATISSFGIALSIAFLAFNLHFRKLKAIKLSSPKLSNITAFGCILVYMAVILLGLDFATLPHSENAFATVCTARVYLLSAGFSLAFGSMFAKTYRVHRIFTRSGSGVCKDKMLQDTQLISLVCALLILDGLVVTLWIVMDPIERHLNNLTLEISSTDRSVVYQPQVEVCRSQHTQGWLGFLYAYKGLLLIVGVYMAWETRHVKIPALNDSQYIGVSVYSVVITSAIVVVLANLISGRVTLAFITITTLILTSTTATLCLLFIPKLHDILARNDVVDPVIHSMGLKMECNTRRFVIDDKRELQYRVEVQNRVYKREILALDAEIHRLEKLLDTNSSASTSSNASLFPQNKPEINITAETAGSICFGAPTTAPKSRTPSITGGLPYLLLSVLPPVIPRASWPSAEYMQVPMRRSVTFSSHPHLEDKRSVAEVCLPAADLLNLRLAHQQATSENKGGIINRIRGIFSRHSSSNRGSSISLSNNQIGLKAAFKSHMGMFSRLIPGSETTASCNALYNTNKNLNEPNVSSLVKSSTDIDRTTIDPTFLCDNQNTSSKENFKTTHLYIKPHETKVNFQLPAGRRSSIAMQNSNQITLRERIKGSPRFPHRILPTCSLSALEEQDTPKVKTKLNATSGNWKSMDVPSVSSIISSEKKILNQTIKTTKIESDIKTIATIENISTTPSKISTTTTKSIPKVVITPQTSIEKQKLENESIGLDHIIVITESET